MFYYRASVRRRREDLPGIEELLAEVKRWKPKKRPEPTGDGLAYVVAYADLQIGKPDGDGTKGTVDRVLTKTDDAAARLKELRKSGRKVDTIYLPQLGDCIEGFNSQGGRLAWRNELTLTEMVRVYRRLLLHVVKTFAPLADRVIVPVVPGNHDEAVRTGDKMSTRYDDSWAIEAASVVADLCRESEALSHVSFVFPGVDELTVTLDVAGTIVGLAHGHQFRSGRGHDWWAKQGHGMQPIGDATLMLSGHLHHLRIEQDGAKTWLQMPSLDGGSTWWRHRTGADAPAGLVTMLVGNGGWGDLAIM
jgi:predicted phosphodiesterase